MTVPMCSQSHSSVLSSSADSKSLAKLSGVLYPKELLYEMAGQCIRVRAYTKDAFRRLGITYSSKDEDNLEGGF